MGGRHTEPRKGDITVRLIVRFRMVIVRLRPVHHTDRDP
jgi:hypothetical protein